MIVARWLLLIVLALPLAEVIAFLAVADAIGFLRALLLVFMTSLAGALVLRHAGGNHIARMRTALGQGTFTSLQADSAGTLILFTGFLLLIPGFITDAIGLVLLLEPLRRSLAVKLGLRAPPTRPDGVVDLDPEQWHQVPDPALPSRRSDERENR